MRSKALLLEESICRSCRGVFELIGRQAVVDAKLINPTFCLLVQEAIMFSNA